MKYVKLIAKPNTWFKEGTEVYQYSSDYVEKKNVTLEEWEACLAAGTICVRGIRIPQYDTEIEIFGPEEREDGELCSCDEFEVTII